MPGRAPLKLPYGRTTLLLIAVVGLDYADRGVLGGVAPSIRDEFGISNTQLGLLAAAFSVVGGLATVPVGVLTDLVRRTSILTVGVTLWSGAMAGCGAAVSFAMLFVMRLVLGVMTATSGPTVRSLAGDLFGRQERGSGLAMIDGGELASSGAGLALAAVASAVIGWRSAFWALAVAGFALAWALRRMPEPRRSERAAAEPGLRGGLRSLGEAVRYVLGVRTLVVVMVAGSLGDLFFAGITLFGVELMVRWYGVAQGFAALVVPVLGVAAFAGLAAGGAAGDRLLRRGHPGGRIAVAMAGYLITVAVTLPAFLTRSIWVALPLFAVGAAALASASPPLDAVRLDVIRPSVWGRSEAVRTLLRIAGQAAAPLAFGLLGDHLGSSDGTGIERAFVVTVPLIPVAALVLLFALPSYPRDADAARTSGSSSER